VLLKLDYEKAYDIVNWQLLEEMLHSRGFGSKWLGWIVRVVKGDSIVVKINDITSPYFRTGKGLRQGDPLSPLLFNLVVDVFSRMLVKAPSRWHIIGFLGAMCPEGVISLQCADDTLLFLQHDTNAACHLKWLMMCFEQLPGMKINYHKSDLTPINLDPEDTKKYAQILCCEIGSFPFRYLRVPLNYEKLKREDIQPIVDRILSRISGWKGRLLSYGARHTLLRAFVASMPIYLMSVIKFPKWVVKAINSHMAILFCNDQENSHRYHLSNIHSLTQKKEFGGVGIPDLRDLNLCLLASWVQRYQDGKENSLREVVDFKYSTSYPNIFCQR
jgi:hypothetical protein